MFLVPLGLEEEKKDFGTVSLVGIELEDRMTSGVEMTSVLTIA